MNHVHGFKSIIRGGVASVSYSDSLNILYTNNELPFGRDNHVVSNIKAYHADSTRCAIIDQAGVLKIIDHGAFTDDNFTDWVTQTKHEKVAQVQLSGLRTAALLENGELWVKEGTLVADFIQQTDEVEFFQLSGSRIAVQRRGELWVKEPALTSTWVSQTPGGRVKGFSSRDCESVLSIRMIDFW